MEHKGIIQIKDVKKHLLRAESDLFRVKVCLRQISDKLNMTNDGDREMQHCKKLESQT